MKSCLSQHRARHHQGPAKSGTIHQAELARRAGIQPAVLNRIERARVDAETAAVDKLLAALAAAPKNGMLK